jgi:hypothetical protein
MGRVKKLVIFSLFTVGAALAQTPPATPPAPPAEEPPAADVDVPMKARANIPVAAMTQQVEVYFQQLEDTLDRMVQLQGLARREKDVIKLNCVGDKLLQLKQLTNIAQQAKTNLQEAIARGDEDARYHEFGRITVASQQGRVMGSEAESCIGEDLSFVGPTQVDVTEPALPDDPTVTVPPDFPIVEPLPVASPQR